MPRLFEVEYSVKQSLLTRNLVVIARQWVPATIEGEWDWSAWYTAGQDDLRDVMKLLDTKVEES